MRTQTNYKKSDTAHTTDFSKKRIMDVKVTIIPSTKVYEIYISAVREENEFSYGDAIKTQTDEEGLYSIHEQAKFFENRDYAVLRIKSEGHIETLILTKEQLNQIEEKIFFSSSNG